MAVVSRLQESPGWTRQFLPVQAKSSRKTGIEPTPRSMALSTRH
jgi:hypothetical protein